MEEETFLNFLKEINQKYKNLAISFKAYNKNYENIIITISEIIENKTDDINFDINPNFNIRISKYYENLFSPFIKNSKNKILKYIYNSIIKKDSVLFIPVSYLIDILEANK